MPLPSDFQMSASFSAETGKVIDYNLNTNTHVEYPNGQKFAKSKGKTYVDVDIEVMSGADQGKKFKIENLLTAIYIGKKGRSQMYIFLETLGIKSEVLDKLTEQNIPDINLMDTIGRQFDGVRKSREGGLYVDLRDPEFIEKKDREEDTSMFGSIDEVKTNDEVEVDADDAIQSMSGSSLFDE